MKISIDSYHPADFLSKQDYSMSGYTPGQFDDAEVDRRLQEELRARQVAGALSRTAGFNDRAAFMSSLIAESAAAASS